MPRLYKLLTPLLLLLSPLAQANDESSSEQDFYEQALVYYQDEDFARAFNTVKTALQIKPEHLPSRILYGEILLQFGEFAAAETQFKRALSFNADTSLVLPKLAQVLALQYKHRELVDTIEANSFSDEVNFVILMYRGRAFESLKFYPEAAAEFELAGLIYPNRASVSLALAGIADKQNRREAYKRLLKKAQNAAPNDPIVRFFEAETLRENGRLRSALRLYNEILEIAPDYHDVRRTRAAVLLEQGQTQAALDDLSTLLEVAPTDPFTLLLQAVALGKADDATKAEAILNDVVGNLSVIDKELYEDFAPIHFLNGAAQFLLGKYVNAERHLLKALESNPHSLNVREMLAEIALKNGEYRKAIDILSVVPVLELPVRSIEIISTSYLQTKDYDAISELISGLPQEVASLPQFVKIRSAALFKSGDSSRAMTTLIESDSAQNDEKATLMLGYHALAVSDFDLAVKMVERLERNETYTLTALNFSGAVFLAKGEAEKAKGYFVDALKVVPSDVVTKLNLIRAQRALGETELAQQQLQELASRYPNNVDVLRARLSSMKTNKANDDYGLVVTKLSQLIPNDRAVLIETINYYLASNQAEAALPLLTTLKDQDTFWPPTLIAQAKVYLQLGNLEQAQRPLRVLFGLVENNRHLLQLGEEFLAAGALDFVERTLVRLENAEYEGQGVTRLKVKLWYRQGKVKEALQLLIARTKTEPNFENSFLLAKLLTQSNEKQSALYYAKQANRKRPSIETIQLLANLQWQLGNRAEALNAVKQYLINRPQDIAVTIVYANMLQQDNQLEAAQAVYLEVLNEEPENLFTLVNLSRLYLLDNKFEQASSYVEKAFELNAGDAVVLDLYGWVEVNRGNLNQGLNLLRDSYSRNASRPSTMYHLAYALVQLDRKGEAKQMLRQAMAMGVEFPEKQLTDELLRSL